MKRHLSGKTINQLPELSYITGNEVIPISVYNEELDRNITYGITVDNLLRLVYERINDNASNAEDIKQQLEDLRAVDDSLTSYANAAAHSIVHLFDKEQELSSQVNTLYYGQNEDAWDNYENPDDDNVTPQGPFCYMKE